MQTYRMIAPCTRGCTTGTHRVIVYTVCTLHVLTRMPGGSFADDSDLYRCVRCYRRDTLSSINQGHRQLDEHWNRFKGKVGETSERQGGAHMGFSKRIDTTLN